jgi:hypothetical protein
MGFFRQQEIRLAVRFLQWQYEKQRMPLPPEEQLERQAATIVDEANRIAKARGRNVLAIIKEMIADVQQKKGN